MKRKKAIRNLFAFCGWNIEEADTSRGQNPAGHSEHRTAAELAVDNCVTFLDVPDQNQEGNDSRANSDSDHDSEDYGGGDPQGGDRCHFNQSINQSNFFDANIPSETRLSGATAELVFNRKIGERFHNMNRSFGKPVSTGQRPTQRDAT